MKTLFKEVQRFKQPWIFILLFSLTGYFVYMAVRRVAYGQPAGDNPAPDAALLILGSLLLAVLALFLFARLITEIREDGIYYKFWPLQVKYKKLSWAEVSEAYVRKYSGLKEYGGWGLRFSFGLNGKAYTVSGNRGLQLKLKNGKNILIGTQKPDKLSEVLLNRGMNA